MKSFDANHLLYVGTANHVWALDRRTGDCVWDTKLNRSFLKVGMGFVNLYFDGEQLFAAAWGRVYCLNPGTGEIVWTSRTAGSTSVAMTFATATGSSAAARQYTSEANSD